MEWRVVETDAIVRKCGEPRGIFSGGTTPGTVGFSGAGLTFLAATAFIRCRATAKASCPLVSTDSGE